LQSVSILQSVTSYNCIEKHCMKLPPHIGEPAGISRVDQINRQLDMLGFKRFLRLW